MASGAFTVFGFTATTTAAAFGTAVAGGALAGAVTGGLKGAVTGAFTAAAFFGVGDYFSNLGASQQLAQSGEVTQGLSRAGLTASQTVAKIAAHAAVGGTMAVLQGGKFGHGFATAGLNEALSGRIGRIGNPGGQIAASALLGGTTSQLVGGKFANGAVTAAFATAFNEGLHAAVEESSDQQRDLSIKVRASIKGILEVSTDVTNGKIQTALKVNTPFKISIGQDGTVKVTQGNLVISANDIADSIGSGIKTGPFTATATVQQNGSLDFTGTVAVPGTFKLFGDFSISFTKNIQVKSSFINNDGLLGQAARPLVNFDNDIDRAVCVATGEPNC